MKVKYFVITVVSIYLVWKLYNYIVYRVKNKELVLMAQTVIDRRNSKIYDFEIDKMNLNVDQIL